VKIKRITKINEREPVYNMYVENHNNFAIESGLVVHNCDSLRGFCIVRYAQHIDNTVDKYADNQHNDVNNYMEVMTTWK